MTSLDDLFNDEETKRLAAHRADDAKERARRCDMLAMRIRELGFTADQNGKPGTSGEYILDVAT